MKQNLTGIWIPSPYGKFYLEASSRGLYRLNFPSAKTKANGTSSRNPVPLEVKSNLRKALALMARYFRGPSTSFLRLKIDYSGYTRFEKKVLRLLEKVPCRRTITYQELARRAGCPKGSRAVGGVMKKNRLPIFLACHRVIGSGGKLGGYSKGLSWKKRLLAWEKAMG